jgi:DNA polymerase III sliding clamp (beta) subunit (PCNA family)
MVLAEAPVAAGTLTVAASELRAGLALVEHAASSDEDSRPILTNVLLRGGPDGLYAAACDNYRISEARIESKGDPGFLGVNSTLLPASDRPALMAWLKSVGKFAEVEITLAERQIAFTYGHRQLVLTLFEGVFPDYRSILDVQLPAVVFTANPVYLAEAGKALSTETTIAVRSASALSPVFLTRDGYREVVMPVRAAYTE